MSTSESVESALNRYLVENGFSESEYTKQTMVLEVGPLSFVLPNPPTRQRAIPLHDLHHVATGYGTDLVGEAEIGVWELRGGCNTVFLWLINLVAIVTGLFLSPRRMLAAWRNARGARTLYVSRIEPARARAMTVPELRRALGVPEQGAAVAAERRLHPRAPKRVLA